MNAPAKSIGCSLALALLLFGATLVLLNAGVAGPPPVLAQGPDGDGVYYVAPDCTGLSVAPCYTTVQQAVDAVDDPADEVWVATGTYTGVNGYGGLSQMVYISKSLSLRGGYSTTFALQDPALYTTTLNAQDNGRVLYIAGSGITLTVEGLELTQGYVSEDGAGVYVTQATVTISDCRIVKNGYNGWEVIAYQGGGVYVDNANVRLENNTLYNNWANNGGAIAVRNNADVEIVNNDIDSNDAYETSAIGFCGEGGGVYVEGSPGVELIGNQIHHNQARHAWFSDGGGVMVRSSDHVVLRDNEIFYNTADLNVDHSTWTDHGGAGLKIYESDHVEVTRNQIYSNTAESTGNNVAATGGGVNIVSSNYVSFTHNLVHHNRVIRSGNGEQGQCGGLYTYDIADGVFAHNEIYANTASDRWGGVVLRGSRITFDDNDVYGNTAQNGHAGGIYFEDTYDTVLRNNRIHHNTASGTAYGGGLHIAGSGHRLERNQIYANVVDYTGGGLQISGSGHTLVANHIFSNTASYGGGIRISADDTLLVNNVLAHNEATGLASGDDGSAAAVTAGDTRWYHTTIADNVGAGSALYAFSSGAVAFTNTIIYSQTTGMRNNGGAVTMTLTLWSSVPTQTVGGVSTFGDITGTAAFAADGYHLTAASDALEQGLVTGVTSDVDGQPRPMGTAPDLGADEFAYDADLALAKAGPASGTAGEMLTYTLTVTNATASQVGADARVVDAVEPTSAVTALSASAPGDVCTTAGAVVTCTISNVATGTQRTVTVWVTPTAAYDGVLTNTATVTPTDAVDPDGAGNADAVTTTVVYVPPTADLWVTKDAPAFVEPGAPLVYELAWGNAGGAAATAVTLTDTLPGGVNFQSADPPPAATDPLVWQLGDLSPGETATATVRVVVGSLDDGTALVNTAEITTTATEAAPIDNTATATTTVYQLGGYDLSLQKAADPAEVEVGDTIGYALWVTNTGELPADVTLIDAIPAGTEYVAGSASALGGTGSLDDSDGIEWIGTLDVGEDVLVTFGVEVVACEGVDCGTIRNVATAEIDGVSYLWQEQVDTVVRCPNLAISGAGPERSPQFSDGTFKRYDVTFTYQNQDQHAHPGVAHTTTVTLTLPEGAQFSASNPIADETAPDKRTKIWHLGDLAAGDSNTITVQVEPHQWLEDGTTVTATVTSQPGVECEPDADNQDTVTTHPTKMELEKQAGNPRWVVTTDPATGDTEYRLWVDYYLRYHYQTTDPARPPVSSYRIDDQWPASLDLERHTSEPDLDLVIIGSRATAADGAVTPLRFEGTETLRVDDPGWLRLQGSTTTVITPGHGVVNEAEQTYETQRTEGTGTEVYTDSARVEFEVPLSPPYISSPQVGSTCASDSLQVRGLTPSGDQVHVYLENITGTVIFDDQVPVDGRAQFTATVDIPAAGEFKVYYLYARAVEGGEESLSSDRIRLMTPSGGGWCPQRSYWEGTLKAGPNQGQERTYFFRNEQAELSSLRWQIPGEYGFWDTQLHLYSCCTEATQAMTVTADNVVYTPTSHDGHWYHFDITGGAHDVAIASQCGDQVVGESGEILIDPDGFIFDVDQGGDYDPVTGMFDPVEPISGVTVTCMMSAPKWGGWVPWPAHLYDQVNPQVTDDATADGITTTGYFAFFTPPGHYYLDVEGIDGYQAWRSPVVEVITQIVHVNVPYTPWHEDVAATVDLTPNGPVSDVITVPVGSAVEWRSTLRATDTLTDLVAWTENPLLRARSGLDPLLEPRGFDAGYLAPGRIYRRAFAAEGVYTYTVRGRTARVVVERPTLYLPLVLRQ